LSISKPLTIDKMADAPSLGDFFKSKGKKKIKASNLNNATTTKTEETKGPKKSAEDDVWEEEQVVAATMKVEVAGKLMREEVKEEEDTSAPAWGNVGKEKKARETSRQEEINEKRFPTLAKSLGSSAINIDDGSDAKINIATSKNHFAALEGDDGSDAEDTKDKRPKSIKAAMISKKKGEFEKVALQREVDKYAKKDTKKKDKRKEDGEDDDDEDEDEEDEEEEAAAPVVEEEGRKKKAPEKKKEDKEVKKPAEEEEDEDKAEDLKIQPDLVASKDKYKGRKKLSPADLPRSEMREEKENKPVNQPSGKKKKFVAVEETEKKIAYADW